jgi:drug/metabolite transporter (DMT)-like permease
LSASAEEEGVKARLCIILGAMLWSFGGVGIKVLRCDYHLSPATIACVRSLIGGLALAWALPRLRGARPLSVAVTAAMFTVVVGTFVAATVRTSAANAIFLQYFFPLLVAIGGAVFFRERLGRWSKLALAVGTAGVLVIFLAGWQQDHDRLGVLLGIISAVAMAAMFLVQRSIRAGSPLALAGVYNLTAAACLLPLAWGQLSMPWPALGIIAAMGVFQLALPYVLVIHGLRTLTAGEASLIALLEPVLNPVWVWAIVGEVPAGWTFIGAGGILLGLVIHFLAATGHKRISTQRTQRSTEGGIRQETELL